MYIHLADSLVGRCDLDPFWSALGEDGSFLRHGSTPSPLLTDAAFHSSRGSVNFAGLGCLFSPKPFAVLSSHACAKCNMTMDDELPQKLQTKGLRHTHDISSPARALARQFYRKRRLLERGTRPTGGGSDRDRGAAAAAL